MAMHVWLDVAKTANFISLVLGYVDCLALQACAQSSSAATQHSSSQQARPHPGPPPICTAPTVPTDHPQSCSCQVMTPDDDTFFSSLHATGVLLDAITKCEPD